MANFKEDLNKVKAFVFDYDGVFTNAQVLIHQSGELLRQSNMRDGFAIANAVKKGYKIAIISGGRSETVRGRMQNLGVKDVIINSTDKVNDIEEFLKKYNLQYDDILYMGDDIPDYPVLKRVGVPTCPADAVMEIKSISKYISQYNGGQGCVRDVLEQVMRLNGDWFSTEDWK